MRGSYCFGSMQGIFQREGCHFFKGFGRNFSKWKGVIKKERREEQTTAAANFYLDQRTAAAPRYHHKRERLRERIGARRFENREAAI